MWRGVDVWRTPCNCDCSLPSLPKKKNGTKAGEFGKWMKRIQILEEGKVPAKVSEKRKRIARKEHRRLLYNFEMDGSTAQKGLWNLAKEKIMKARGELPKI